MDNLHGEEAAFSIHNIVELGFKYERKPGDWYGSMTTAMICEKLNDKYNPFLGLKFCFLVNEINVEEIEKKMKDKWDSLLLIIGYKLGIGKINPEYYTVILKLINHKNCIGIIGGQSTGALYFTGCYDNKLIFLDPHITQTAINNLDELWVEHLSYHYPTPLLLPLEEINTDFAIGNCIIIKRFLLEK